MVGKSTVLMTNKLFKINSYKSVKRCYWEASPRIQGGEGILCAVDSH